MLWTQVQALVEEAVGKGQTNPHLQLQVLLFMNTFSILHHSFYYLFILYPYSFIASFFNFILIQLTFFLTLIHPRLIITTPSYFYTFLLCPNLFFALIYFYHPYSFFFIIHPMILQSSTFIILPLCSFFHFLHSSSSWSFNIHLSSSSFPPLPTLFLFLLHHI